MEFRDGIVENFRAREFGETTFDVTRCGGGIAGVNVAEVSLAFDEITLVRQHHERVADGCVAVRMILHRVPNDIGDLDEPPVVLLMQRPEDAPLHRLQTVGEIRNRTIADDVAGVIQKPAIHARVQADAKQFRVKRLVGDGLDDFGDDVLLPVAVRVGGFLRGLGFSGRRLGAFDGQFRLVRIFFLLRRTHERRALSNRTWAMARFQPVAL